ncbi:MAG: hypothetical protein AAGE52_41370, partial [Myxococcota bacterium]
LDTAELSPHLADRLRWARTRAGSPLPRDLQAALSRLEGPPWNRLAANVAVALLPTNLRELRARADGISLRGLIGLYRSAKSREALHEPLLRCACARDETLPFDVALAIFRAWGDADPLLRLSRDAFAPESLSREEVESLYGTSAVVTLAEQLWFAPDDLAVILGDAGLRARLRQTIDDYGAHLRAIERIDGPLPAKTLSRVKGGVAVGVQLGPDLVVRGFLSRRRPPSAGEMFWVEVKKAVRGRLVVTKVEHVAPLPAEIPSPTDAPNAAGNIQRALSVFAAWSPDALKELLTPDNPESLRLRVASAWGRTASPAALAWVLRQPHHAVADRVAESLLRSGVVTQELVSWSLEGNRALHAVLSKAPSEFDDDALFVEALTRAAAGATARLRVRPAERLATLGNPLGVEILTSLLDAPERSVRHQAARSLAIAGALEALRTLIHAEYRVARYALLGLMRSSRAADRELVVNTVLDRDDGLALLPIVARLYDVEALDPDPWIDDEFRWM